MSILWQKKDNLSTVFFKFVVLVEKENPLFFFDGEYEDITFFSLYKNKVIHRFFEFSTGFLRKVLFKLIFILFSKTSVEYKGSYPQVIHTLWIK